MRYDSTGRRSRRIVKVGIAAVTAVAASGLLFASQAGAATVRAMPLVTERPAAVRTMPLVTETPTTWTKDVRVKAPHGICAMTVSEPGMINKSISFPHGWKGTWVNTHFQARVGDVVEVVMITKCNVADDLGPTIPDRDSLAPKFRVSSQPGNNAWFDASHSRVF